MEFVCRIGTAEGRVLQEVHQARDEAGLRHELMRRGVHVFSVERRILLPLPSWSRGRKRDRRSEQHLRRASRGRRRRIRIRRHGGHRYIRWRWRWGVCLQQPAERHGDSLHRRMHGAVVSCYRRRGDGSGRSWS